MFQDSHSYVYFIIASTVFFAAIVIIIVRFLFQIQKKNRKYVLAKEQFQQELLQTQLEIQEQTLKNIGQEIHDNIGQTLSLAKLHLNTLITSEETAEKVNSTKELVSKAIQDLRSLSKTLHTDALLSKGLSNAIAYELQLMENSGAYTTTLSKSGIERTLASQKELILFRIVQEALHNSIKHADASKIAVSLDYREDELLLAVNDNGKGFAPEKQHDGSGLLNMQTRAAMIGGSMHVESNGKGTSIYLQLPIHD